MLFLINKNQKNKILNEYYSKIINLITINIVILFFIFLVFLFPAYLIMNVDKRILTEKISPLEKQISDYKDLLQKENLFGINDDISILNLNTEKNTVNMYNEIRSIYKEIPNIKISNINIDTLNKKIIVVANVDTKDTAILLVDKLNTTKYKGAEIPYSIFSQNKNFNFSQTLTYE